MKIQLCPSDKISLKKEEEEGIKNKKPKKERRKPSLY
jgi:hypothetical protein